MQLKFMESESQYSHYEIFRIERNFVVDKVCMKILYLNMLPFPKLLCILTYTYKEYITGDKCLFLQVLVCLEKRLSCGFQIQQQN